jgi:hypothetical protein
MRLPLSLGLLLLFCSNVFGQSSKPSSSSDVISCGLDIRWLNSTGSINYVRSTGVPEELSFLVHLAGGSDCGSAEVTVTATYLTESQNFICSGTIRSAMNVSSAVQAFNISIRPFTQLDFVRWRNQPGIRGEQQGKRLPCMNLDGTSDVSDTDRQKAGWMRLSIGVLSSGGGLGLTEAMFRFVP